MLEDRTDRGTSLVSVLRLRRKTTRDWSTYIDQGVNATVLNHPPRLFGGREIRLSKERNIRKCIPVNELDSPLYETEDALQYAVDAHAKEAPFAGLRLVSHGAELPDEVDDGDKETP